MANSRLIELSYYDPTAQVRLSAYADTGGLGQGLLPPLDPYHRERK